ncbi:phage tail tube protein [Plastoroseomonas hellenica]|uniref:phage tail tube protein n=1 Tax=Plastoroseomonas hellenica TaxID=2687306 RepID=UPI001BA635D8|nr:phage tail tube protein [Plastoroseomonas hellenica]MBR0643987.1 hypothetical protein [Plastoroseomonas hellenica]
MAQTVGIVDIVWQSTKIPTEKGAKLRIGGPKNNAVVTGRQVDYAQEWQHSEITATTRLARGQRFTDLYKSGQGELQVLLDTGQTYVFTDAFLVDDRPEITGGEGGKIQLKWAAGEPQEIIANG